MGRPPKITVLTSSLFRDGKKVLPTEVEVLTDEESRELRHLEGVIADGLKQFEAVGRALMKIRDYRLFRATHKWFKDYLRDRWNMGGLAARVYIAAADVAADLKTVPKLRGLIPKHHRTLEPLGPLPKRDRIQVYTKAVEASGNKVPTYDAVKRVASDHLGATKGSLPVVRKSTQAYMSPEVHAKLSLYAAENGIGIVAAASKIVEDFILGRLPR